MKELDFIQMVKGQEGIKRELFKVAVIFFIAFMLGGFSVRMSLRVITGKLTKEARQTVLEAKEDNILIFAEGGGIIKVENISLQKAGN